MADLSLDLNPASPTYGDLLVIDGDLVLTSDVDPRGTNPVLQAVVQNIRYFLGEWFLNNTGGVPYIQQIFQKPFDQSKTDTALIDTILGTPGVLELTSWSFTPIFGTRNLEISFAAISTSGPIDWSGTLGAA